jgi:hypothetical protein
MRGFFRLLEGLALFGLAFLFLRWFIKGLFGKYFIFFWIYLFIAIGMFVYDRATEEPYDTRTGAEIFLSNPSNR